MVFFFHRDQLEEYILQNTTTVAITCEGNLIIWADARLWIAKSRLKHLKNTLGQTVAHGNDTLILILPRLTFKDFDSGGYN